MLSWFGAFDIWAIEMITIRSLVALSAFLRRGVRSKPGFRRRPLCGFLAVLCGMTNVAVAATSGDFTYTDNGTSITIDGYLTGAPVDVVIPAEIDIDPDPVAVNFKPVTAIGSNAFALRSELTSVTIPASVTTIGDQAFLSCSALTSIGDISSVTSIGNGAFASCGSLTSVTIPSSITTIGNSVFASCSGLTSIDIPAGVTSIGSSAFLNCSGLTSLAIPTSVTSIGASAFSYCSALTSMTIPHGVETIQSGLFSDCVNLSSVFLPTSVKTIGQSAFAKCSSLTSISIPAAVTSIGSYAFTYCSSLTSVEIPSGVPSIGTSAFEFCTSLTSVTIPSSVWSIGNNAFRSCRSLLVIAIPAVGSTSIGTNVFEGCTSLTSISVNAGNTSYSSAGGVLFNKTGLTLIAYPGGKVGPYVIPSIVTTIRTGAFRFCAGVTSIGIPSSVNSIGVEAFSGCSALTSFSVDGANAYFKSVGGILLTKSGLSLFTYPGGLSGAFSIPSGVTNISISSFRYCAALTEVTFPATVTTINDTAFANCNLLTAATFLGNAPPTFGANVFLSAAPTFSVYFDPSATGFTVPTWKGYPASANVPNSAVVNWLLGYGLPSDSDMKSDANGDGVNLLMAYALNLDPNQNQSGNLPQPVFAANQMSLTFYAGAAEITYAVQVSPDMQTWTTEGVTLSAPNENQIRTATVDMTGPSRYMRLSVSH